MFRMRTQFSVLTQSSIMLFLFFFNDTATTEIYTLSLHDALPISSHGIGWSLPSTIWVAPTCATRWRSACGVNSSASRSEEHTSELQSRSDLVCRLLLEKKKKKRDTVPVSIRTYYSRQRNTA